MASIRMSKDYVTARAILLSAMSSLPTHQCSLHSPDATTTNSTGKHHATRHVYCLYVPAGLCYLEAYAAQSGLLIDV
jgi:hypothetical protein